MDGHQDEFVQHLLRMASFCDEKSPFVASLLRCFAEFDQEKLVRGLFDDLEGKNLMLVLPGIRLAGALNHLVVSNRDQTLASVFPPKQMMFNQDTKREVKRVLQEHFQHLKQFCKFAPQTNEVRRSAALICGISTVLHGFDECSLLELGSSSGLNLLLDTYSFDHFPRSGSSNVRMSSEWIGDLRPAVNEFKTRIVSRKGCDLNPINLLNQDEFERGVSYIWPDQLDRVSLFREAAKSIPKDGSLIIEHESAEIFLEKELPLISKEHPTVVMHSVFLQYPPAEIRAKIESLIRRFGASASPKAPLIWLRFELEPILSGSKGSSEAYLMDAIVFDGQGERRTIMAKVHPHGYSIEWLL